MEIPYFRGVFMRDELPNGSNPIECVIVDIKNHYVCYIKVYYTRCYFDSFGRKTPLELGYYLKTAEQSRTILPW